ncbi:phage tail protein [Litorivita pollutaquae]|uniref:Phage tail protein n=1 Tax=Litorivita pollutaquae TaxID=2200892 RepID=A0A2V4NEI0_9RHOB|nr:head-tail adaptor protein [Litorivita pollutaquae]PYC48713.1 phage tail protein [Litorivita pollutaquae]
MAELPNLSRALALETPLRTPDGAGGYDEVWQVLGTLWAEVIAAGGRQRTGAATAVSDVGYRVIVRAAPPGDERRPRPEQRFREGARVFNILAVAEDDPTGRYLTCYANEELVP